MDLNCDFAVFIPSFGRANNVVARALGRHYIGFELDSKIFKIAQKRLEVTRTLFD